MQTNLAYSYSLKLISRRDYSTFKLRKKLKEKKYPSPEIEEAIQQLLEKKFINDENYYERKTIQLWKKNFSPNHIIQYCHREGFELTQGQIANTIEKFGHSEQNHDDELLKQEIEKRLLKETRKSSKKTSSSPTKSWEVNKLENIKKNKVISSLVRKGHSYDHLQKLYEIVKNEVET